MISQIFADKGVVVPNNDMLYSSGFYDFAGDLLNDVLPMDHGARYWNVMILDAYTHGPTSSTPPELGHAGPSHLRPGSAAE